MTLRNSVAVCHRHFVLDTAFVVSPQNVGCHYIEFFIWHFFQIVSSVLKYFNLVQSFSVIILTKFQVVINNFIVNLRSCPFFLRFLEFDRQILPRVFTCKFAFVHTWIGMSHIVIPYSQEYSVR